MTGRVIDRRRGTRYTMRDILRPGIDIPHGLFDTEVEITHQALTQPQPRQSPSLASTMFCNRPSQAMVMNTSSNETICARIMTSRGVPGVTIFSRDKK